jgi:hypothetical protein
MTTTHWRDFWGDPSDRPNPYGSRDQIYAEGYHRGEDVANNGSVEFVPVVRPGVIVAAGYGPKVGSYVVVKPDKTLFSRPEYDGYSHLYGPVMLRSGRVETGDILTRTAGARENPGSSWGGPHLHFTVTEHPDGVYDIGYVDYNPNPIIDAALRGEFTPAPSGGNGVPLPTEPTEEDDMFTDDDRKRLARLEKTTARLEVALARAARGPFFKHGDMQDRGQDLWLYVLPNGDFVRIRDKATAALYKARNGGIQSTVLSGDAIRLLRDDLIAAGGRDLSAVPHTEDVIDTPANETSTD